MWLKTTARLECEVVRVYRSELERERESVCLALWSGIQRGLRLEVIGVVIGGGEGVVNPGDVSS